MKPAGMLVLNVVVVVAAIAAYHLIFHADASRDAGGGDEQVLGGTALVEREAMDRQLGNAHGLFATAYDEPQMQALVDKAGVTLTPEQAEQVLPMLHAHLLALQENLQAARDATLAGTRDAQRSVFHARAAQEHARFQSKLRTIIPSKDADRLFRAYPSMIPPVPGSLPTGKRTPDGRPQPVVIHSEGGGK